jgi:hypothetical protein
MPGKTTNARARPSAEPTAKPVTAPLANQFVRIETMLTPQVLGEMKNSVRFTF